MLKIRLQMTGRRNDRHFRIIVTEHIQGPKSGKYVEKIGFINPRTKESKIDVERAKYWISVGAQPTDRVYNMLVDEGVFEGPKRNVLPKKTPIAKDEPEESADESKEEASAEAVEQGEAEVDEVADAQKTPEEKQVAQGESEEEK